MGPRGSTTIGAVIEGLKEKAMGRQQQLPQPTPKPVPCAECQKPVVWALVGKDHIPMAFDWEPNQNGSHVLTLNAATGNILAWVFKEDVPGWGLTPEGVKRRSLHSCPVAAHGEAL